ncbi:MAG: C40 family peptidase [Gemmatimonadaceae bacterium]
MFSRASFRPIVVAPLTLLVLAGCAQGSTYGISNGTILSTVIRAGEAIGRSGSSTGSSRGGSTTRTSRGIPRSPAPTAVAARVLGTADRYVGVRYTWGGNTPSSGFDCSGFTKYVFAAHGIELPRTSREQARAGQGVPLDFGAMLPGDILLFAEPREAISHVAIYVGGGEIIHASSARGGVGYLDLDAGGTDWYVQNMVAVRRLTSNGRSLVQSLKYLTIPGTPLDPPDRAPLPR